MLLPIHIEEAKKIKALMVSIKKEKEDDTAFIKLNDIANSLDDILENDDITDAKKTYLSESKKKEMEKVIMRTESRKVEAMNRLESLYKSMEMFYPKDKMLSVIEELKKIL